ncbi:MAG: putative membrane protein [Phenylobacterium sp.]|jgi:uncharacterized membrane protein
MQSSTKPEKGLKNGPKKKATLQSKVLITLITIVSIGYPLIVFFGLKVFSPNIMAGLLLALIVARLTLMRSQITPWVKTSLICASVLLCFAALFNSTFLIQFYPVVVSLTFLAVFALSLYRPPCVIETLARLTDPDLPEQGVKYTIKVTKAWCVFFLSNALIAAYTAIFMSLEHWTLYNGLISYGLIGLMFGIEYMIRIRVKSKYRAQNLAQNAQEQHKE